MWIPLTYPTGSKRKVTTELEVAQDRLLHPSSMEEVRAGATDQNRCSDCLQGVNTPHTIGGTHIFEC